MSPIEERSISQQDLMIRVRTEIVGKYLKEFPDQLRTSVNLGSRDLGRRTA